MLPPTQPLTAEQRRLLKLFSGLGQQERAALLLYAEFLVTRGVSAGEGDSAPTVLRQPEPIPRPERESVVGAIKRLTRTYPMLERSDMLDETSSLMTGHVMQGRSAADVIDSLEKVFADHYRRYREQHARIESP